MKACFASALLAGGISATSLRGLPDSLTIKPDLATVALQTDVPLASTIDFAAVLDSGFSTCNYPGVQVPDLSKPWTTIQARH